MMSIDISGGHACRDIYGGHACVDIYGCMDISGCMDACMSVGVLDMHGCMDACMSAGVLMHGCMHLYVCMDMLKQCAALEQLCYILFVVFVVSCFRYLVIQTFPQSLSHG